ncbi:MAG TPA: hypothetical protein DCY48_04605 [Candidatus Magasanikbacteria bacterium]|uniref:Uncharacterized protein n=1 Tax=Candidatus Magasanikbacteria bacterium GW2011_GWA2_46_17 TaxID=1619042 RepID=A0A0G1S0R5_9BACT|nr:MAG: hypothetical protein UX39_C0006G0012 [Candidatus Magasanikbacteria bacterium GW2011_GWA2_46_17]OGH77689.1 MAG: hypothetical protein A3I74_02945 [Candidatus Magasanikbacteria bacterium RIFCSPLOWO2_02_FULL_47_16]OGH79552.1 MAG: hypothetical protein A3C10_00460 [Candidatus Magasanikbacteria bacterium RIFCSPHIGHO2_02_FULL_48_18]HAZ29022.1 hypothetical protein [Candidatus Magasanikbacteria bacterium]
MKKLFFFFTAFLVAVSGFAHAPAVYALQDKDPLGLNYGKYTGLGNEDVRFSTAKIINTALGILGTVAIVIIIYAGFVWMTSAGNEDQSKKAQKILFAAVIGLIVILSSFIITRFLLTQLYEATTNNVYFN